LTNLSLALKFSDSAVHVARLRGAFVKVAMKTVQYGPSWL
jgi:hypothetical protein